MVDEGAVVTTIDFSDVYIADDGGWLLSQEVADDLSRNAMSAMDSWVLQLFGSRPWAEREREAIAARSLRSQLKRLPSRVRESARSRVMAFRYRLAQRLYPFDEDYW